MNPLNAAPNAPIGLTNWWRVLPPRAFFPAAGLLAPWFAAAALGLALAATYVGFIRAADGSGQGQAFRILFVHVPSAWMSLLIYLAMAFWAGIGLVMKTRLSSIIASAMAPTGALFTFLALWSGALWGRPTWGAWWVWDARLTSELVLLFFYLGIVALQSAIDDPRRADRSTGILALIGVVNVPIVFYSVQWWSTLHQTGGIAEAVPAVAAAASVAGTWLMLLAFAAYSAAVILLRVQNLILERERRSAWVTDLRRTAR